jgi:hypothetical protein
MKRSKLNRRPLDVVKNAEVIPVAPVSDWIINLGNGKSLDAFCFSDIEFGEKILTELNIFLRHQKKPKNYAYQILEYIEHIALVSGAVSNASLKSYRAHLDKQEIKLNTKAQKFSTCKQFVQYLIDSGVVRQQKLIKNFEMEDVESIESFTDIATKDKNIFVESLSPFTQEIEKIKNNFNLDIESAERLFYCEKSMEVIHKESILLVQQALNDIRFVNSIIDNITEEEKLKYKNIENFSDCFKDTRTEDDAFKLLYSHFKATPPGTDLWPKGVYDFFKTRGWASSSIRKTLTNKASLLKNALSNEELQKNKNIKDWSLSALNKKSAELCMKILYVQFGRFIPSSKKWPNGMADYLRKTGGWQLTRVQSAFFMDKHIQQPLLVAMLSQRELRLNVDSAFYYTYTDSITPAFEKHKVNFFAGKDRGKPSNTELSDKDPLVLVVKEYINNYTNMLSKIKGGDMFLRKENGAIFSHIHRKEGVTQEVRLYDSGTASDWVQPLIEKISKDHPILKALIVKRVTGHNFRPTHVIIDVFKGVSQGQIKNSLNHSSSSTTDGYTSRLETASLIKQKHVNFQNYIIEQSRKVLDKKVLEEINDEDALNDLGYDKKVVFSDTKLVAEWIAYRSKINNEKNRLKLENPSRWELYWQVILAEYEALLSMVDSRNYAAAEEIAPNIELPFLD